ncbi:hypothetical protein BS78_03G101600 [Paspalum vaginatum]|nr:hypothetical protein BS78_03G101600 [Paspalum vaginatum]
MVVFSGQEPIASLVGGSHQAAGGRSSSIGPRSAVRHRIQYNRPSASLVCLAGGLEATSGATSNSLQFWPSKGIPILPLKKKLHADFAPKLFETMSELAQLSHGIDLAHEVLDETPRQQEPLCGSRNGTARYAYTQRTHLKRLDQFGLQDREKMGVPLIVTIQIAVLSLWFPTAMIVWISVADCLVPSSLLASVR